MTITVRSIERIAFPALDTFATVIGAVRLGTVPGEIFALLVRCEAEPRWRAIYWDREQRQFTYFAVDDETARGLFPTVVVGGLQDVG